MDKIVELMRKILGMPVVASEHGMEVDKLIVYVHLLMGALFVGWIAYFIYALIRFNSRSNPKADHVGVRGHMSSWIELAVACVEGILLIGFAVPLWAHAADDFPGPDKHPTNLRIVAQQFAWNVFYPGADGEFGRRDISLVTADNPWGLDRNDPKGKDDFQTLDEIHVPVNKPVVIMLTSKDVIHSFKVIAMRVCQDAIPGVPIPLHFTPNTIGVFQINCAQLCGIGHSSMAHGRIHVDSQADYDKWLAEKVKGAGKPAPVLE